METWIKISLALCVCGFLREFHPATPFIVEYLISPRFNFTTEQINKYLFPIENYTRMMLLVPIFIVTDMLLYKPIIIVGVIAAVINWSIYAWCTTLHYFIVAGVLSGFFSATEIAYSTYIYANVEKDHYHKVTSHARSALLLGHSIAGLTGQVLFSTKLLTTHGATYISIAGTSISIIVASSLPSVKKSIYFHRHDKSLCNSESERDAAASKNSLNKTLVGKCKSALKLIWGDFLFAFKDKYVLTWSIWWVLGDACYSLGYTYNQVLYEIILKDSGQSSDILCNGAVEGISSLIGAVVALTTVLIPFNWEYVGFAIVATGSIIEGVFLYMFSISSNIWFGYASYSTFVIGFQTLITIANAEVARNINEDSYALIFGVNTLLSLILQNTTIFLVTNGDAFALFPRAQYAVFGGCFSTVGFIFLVVAFCHMFNKTRASSSEKQSCCMYTQLSSNMDVHDQQL